MGLFDGFAGSVLGAGASIYSARRAEMNAQRMQQAQLDWERERAQNAHQWEVEDLKKAGLNPILSAGGSGATTGGISAPTPDVSGYAQAGQFFATTALDAQRVKNETEQKEVAIIKGQAEAENIIADSVNKYAENGLITAQTAESMARAGLISKQQATEISKQALNYSQTYKNDAETKLKRVEVSQRIERFTNELEILKQQANEAKARKDWSRANALIHEYQAKHRKLAFWVEQVGNILGGAQKGASAAAIAASL